MNFLIALYTFCDEFSDSVKYTKQYTWWLMTDMSSGWDLVYLDKKRDLILWWDLVSLGEPGTSPDTMHKNGQWQKYQLGTASATEAVTESFMKCCIQLVLNNNYAAQQLNWIVTKLLQN